MLHHWTTTAATNLALFRQTVVVMIQECAIIGGMIKAFFVATFKVEVEREDNCQLKELQELFHMGSSKECGGFQVEIINKDTKCH